MPRNVRAVAANYLRRFAAAFVSDSAGVAGLAGFLGLAAALGVDGQAAAQTSFTVNLSGAPNVRVPGFVPNGDPLVTGVAELTIYPNNTMDYNIVLSDDRYRVTQAHFYNINTNASGTNSHGDSIICWGGRWASGGDSDDFLVGAGYSNGRLGSVAADPANWFLMLHTEGGHFANDSSGGLIEYQPNPSGPQETSVTGVPQSERSRRFNARVGRTLLDLTLRERNTSDTRGESDPRSAVYDPVDGMFDFDAPSNQNDTPFPDAAGNLWVEPDGIGGWRLTPAAVDAGYDLTTEYLFYLYDDQGPSWDYGGAEGALGGFLAIPPEVEGDLDGDGRITRDDWVVLQQGYGTDLTGLGPEQRRQAGDLDLDGRHTLADIQEFRRLFRQAGRRFVQTAPEPSLLPAAIVTVLAFRRWRSASPRNTATSARA